MVMGHEVGGRLAEALGLDPRTVEKLVIEVETDALVRVYVRGLVDDAAFRRLAEVVWVERVRDVTVADDCTVTVVPKE